jgi:hypothetical protein
LPDGLFSNQKSHFELIWESLGWENVATYYGHSEYFTNIWYILWPLGTVCVHLVHFSGFGIMPQEQSGNPVRVRDEKKYFIQVCDHQSCFRPPLEGEKKTVKSWANKLPIVGNFWIIYFEFKPPTIFLSHAELILRTRGRAIPLQIQLMTIVIVIYPNRSDFSRQCLIVYFYPKTIDATLLHPLYFLGSASILYKPLYRPLLSSNILDSIMFGTNKGYHSCSPCHHFHTVHIKSINSFAMHKRNRDSNPRSFEPEVVTMAMALRRLHAPAL